MKCINSLEVPLSRVQVFAPVWLPIKAQKESQSAQAAIRASADCLLAIKTPGPRAVSYQTHVYWNAAHVVRRLTLTVLLLCPAARNSHLKPAHLTLHSAGTSS